MHRHYLLSLYLEVIDGILSKFANTFTRQIHVIAYLLLTIKDKSYRAIQSNTFHTQCRHIEHMLFVFVFFVLIVVERPGKQFFSHVETEPPIPGFYQYFWGVNVSCSRKQHTDPAENRTRVSRSGFRRSNH